MNQNEEGTDGNNLERTSFPLYRPKSRTPTTTTTTTTAAKRDITGEWNRPDGEEELTGQRLGIDEEGNPAAVADMSNPFLMNPLLAMGLQLPQLALFMQQQQPPPPTPQPPPTPPVPPPPPSQQQQQQQPPPPPQGMGGTAPLMNPFLPQLLPTPMPMYGTPPLSEPSKGLLLDETQKGTIMGSTTNTRTMPRVVKGAREALTKEDSPGTTSSSKQPYVCEICNEWFFSREKLVIHLVMNHSMYHCQFCSQLFESEEILAGHEQGHHLPLECDMCKTSLPTSEALAEHYEAVHDVRTCVYCGVLVRPKSYYEVHVRRKHFVSCGEALKQEVGEQVRIIERWDGQEANSVWTFTCRLCGKERKRLETFGHFFSYHRLSLSCLIQLLSSEGIMFAVQGTPAPGSSSNVQNSSQLQSSDSTAVNPTVADESSNVDASQTSGITAMSSSDEAFARRNSPVVATQRRCTACTNTFSVQVPKLAHDLFCRRNTDLALCKFCDRTFISKSSRSAHVSREHSNLPCLFPGGCPALDTFYQEPQLLSHYLLHHGMRLCSYCRTLQSAHNFGTHLKVDHMCSSSAKVMKNSDSDLSGTDLFHIQTYDNSVSVICSLCDADITSLMRDISSFFKHVQHHRIAMRAALILLESHPLYESNCSGQSELDHDSNSGKSSLWDTLLSATEEMLDMGSKHSDLLSVLESKEVSAGKSKEKKGETTVDGKKKGIQEDQKTKNGNSLEDSGGHRKSNPDGSEESSSELSTDEEDMVSDGEAEVEAADNDEVTEEDDEEFLPKGASSKSKGKGTKRGTATQDLNEMGEADIDPTEVECVLTDSSDDEGTERREDEEGLVGQETQDDLIEQTMQQMFQETRQETEQPKNTTKCEMCGGNFSSKEGPRELLDHMTTLHGLSLSPYCAQQEFPCSVHGCRDVFSSSGSLKFHLSEVHNQGQGGVDSESFRTYLCPFCAIRSASKTSMRQHVFTSHAEGCAATHPREDLAHRCRYCTRLFWRTEERDDHQVEAHKDRMDNFFKCYVCSSLFSSKVCLNRHAKQAHADKQLFSSISFKCKMCLLTFPSVALMREHFRESHPTALVFHCRHCNTTLKTKKTLKTHIKNVHSESRRRDCSLCGKVLWSKRAHAIHYRMKHSAASKVGFRCRICQRRFDSKDERKLHYQVDHEGESPYHCAECGKGFASKSGMYGHRQLHTGSGVSKCQYCGKEFTRKDSYNEHLLIHNGPRHKCPHCPKEFVQRSNLVRHIRIHTGEKPYKCLYCEKRFSDKGACNSHIRVHTREETCSCPYCGQTFSKKQKLKYHIRKHTGEGLINCEICSKSFTNSFALKEHRVIHNRQTQILCQQCGKGFNSEKYLQRHVAIVHEPSHTFSCPLCPKVFSQQARLKAHLMTHTGVKHIKCLLCDKAYSVRKSLRRHLLEKHEISPEHPQYKHCFYAMSAAEAGLHIPEGVPTSAHPTEDEDSTSQSSPKEEEEEKLQLTVKKSPKKAATVGRKPVAPKHPTASAAFEDYSSIPSGKTEGRRPGRPRKSPNTKKPNEDKSTSPSTSGEGRPRTIKKIRQKGSPRKVTQKESEDEEKGEIEGEVQPLPGPQKARPAQKKRSNSNAGKVKQNKLRSSPARKLQLEEEVQEAEVCIEELPPSSSPARISPTVAPTSTLGTTRKKRRVEAIVETLQKSSNSPSSSGNSPRDVKEEIEDDDDVKMEIKEELEEEDKQEPSHEGVEEGGGASAVPTLARLSPLFISKPRRKPAEPSSRSLRQSPARSIKASRSDEEGSDEYS